MASRDLRAAARSVASTSSEVHPGEIVTLHGAEIAPPPGARRRQPRSARCTFEFVYFTRPDIVWDDRNVHHVRQRLGERARHRGAGRRRRGDPRARLVDPGRDRLLRRERHPLQRRPDQEPLHRPHVHRADPGPPRAWRRPEVQRARREPRRQAGRDDRRLAGARHHGRAAREAAPRRRRHRGARAHHVPADHPRLPLRRRHGPRRRPDGRPPDGRRDARAHRRRLPGVPVARRDDAGDRPSTGHCTRATPAATAIACFTGQATPMRGRARPRPKLCVRGRRWRE